MKTKSHLLLITGIIFFIVACQKVPITGRKQIKLLPDSELTQMALSNYSQFLTQNPPLPPTNPSSIIVEKVGKKVAAAVDTFLVRNGMASKVEEQQWEYKTVESKDVNAWCMPGGKIVVYTGLLPVTKDEAGLAVVIGHEVAHAIANHGNERMSQEMIVQLGGMGLAIAMQQKPQQTQQIFNQVFGVGSTLGILAYSRTHELEADRLGIIFMAMAGYNPERALSFWTDMAAASTTQKPPEIVSTHPGDEHRISEIQKYLPEALTYYKPVPEPVAPKPVPIVKQTTTAPKTTTTTTKTATSVKPVSKPSTQIKPGTILKKTTTTTTKK